jgi:hypothetical protein
MTSLDESYRANEGEFNCAKRATVSAVAAATPIVGARVDFKRSRPAEAMQQKTTANAQR